MSEPDPPLPRPQVSGYPGSHGIPAMAGSMYPGQASLLDQTDSWNHRPQEMSMWQPSAEVSGARLRGGTDRALPGTFSFWILGCRDWAACFSGQEAPLTQMLSGVGVFLVQEREMPPALASRLEARPRGKGLAGS